MTDAAQTAAADSFARKATQAIEAMRTLARAQTTTTLIEGVAAIGASHTIAPELKLSRAVMLDVIEEREGEEIATQLLESIGD